MKFKVTVRHENGELIDEIETDCIIGSLHDCSDESGDAYQNIFYADCEPTTVARSMRACMSNLKELMQDKQIAMALLMDDAEENEKEEPKGKEVN